MIYIPNVFSPNDDGNNDQWKIFSSNPDLVFEAEIFDRWGNRIASWKSSKQIVWDGTFKGQPATQGVYVYVIKYRDQLKEYVVSGNITLLRKKNYNFFGDSFLIVECNYSFQRKPTPGV